MVLELENPSDLQEAHAALFDSHAPGGAWILCNYVGPITIRMTAAGEDGLQGLARELDDSKIQYAIIRIDVPTPRLTDEQRDVLVTWTGPRVEETEKIRKAIHRNEVATHLPSYSASVRADDLSRLTLENLRAAVKNYSGGDATV